MGKRGTTMVFKGKMAEAVVNALAGRAVVQPLRCQHRFEKFSNGIISCQDCGEPKDSQFDRGAE